MAQLAIKGHEKRGAEVIALLEMLGGRNTYDYRATYDNLCYYISTGTNIICHDWVNNCYEDEDVLIFSLEEFLERFPYKVGDKVIDTKTDRVVEIYKAHWSETNNRTYYDVKCFDNTGYVRSHIFLQPYKEEIMESIIDTVKESEGRYRIVLNHQFDMEVDEGEYYAVRRKPQYPKTYEECCEVLGYEPDEDEINCYQGQLIELFVKLLICRDAYWRITGEQMGLGKPWQPDYHEKSYEQGSPIKYVIYYTGTYITKERKCTPSYILAFPTEEMRDAFFENFKELIEICKELL